MTCATRAAERGAESGRPWLRRALNAQTRLSPPRALCPPPPAALSGYGKQGGSCKNSPKAPSPPEACAWPSLDAVQRRGGLT